MNKRIQIFMGMVEAKLPEKFIVDAIYLSMKSDGICELLKLWYEEDDPKERNEIIADIQDCIFDRQTGIEVINIDDLDCKQLEIDAGTFYQKKQKFLKLINENHGGISNLSKQTGIPTPYLNRFFDSYGMPKEEILQRILDVIKTY